jgi:hypothetical protein
VVFVVPGSDVVSGIFEGVQAVAAHISTCPAEDPIDVLKWEDWMPGVDYVAGLVQVHLQRLGQRHDFRVIFLVSVADDHGHLRISRMESFSVIRQHLTASSPYSRSVAQYGKTEVQRVLS